MVLPPIKTHIVKVANNERFGRWIYTLECGHVVVCDKQLEGYRRWRTLTKTTCLICTERQGKAVPDL